MDRQLTVDSTVPSTEEKSRLIFEEGQQNFFIIIILRYSSERQMKRIDLVIENTI